MQDTNNEHLRLVHLIECGVMLYLQPTIPGKNMGVVSAE
jgi:hypothetical protein